MDKASSMDKGEEEYVRGFDGTSRRTEATSKTNIGGRTMEI
jgi:hypothetical protein